MAHVLLSYLIYPSAVLACRRYRQDTSAARQAPKAEAAAGAQQQQAAAAVQPLQQVSELQQQQDGVQAQQAQQPLLQGCSRLKLHLPLPVASAAPKGNSAASAVCTIFVWRS